MGVVLVMDFAVDGSGNVADGLFAFGLARFVGICDRNWLFLVNDVDIDDGTSQLDRHRWFVVHGGFVVETLLSLLLYSVLMLAVNDLAEFVTATLCACL